jgi:hypothetical protein
MKSEYTNLAGQTLFVLFLFWVWGASGALGEDKPPKVGPVKLVGEVPAMVVDPSTSSGEVWLALRNEDGGASAPVHLTVGSFVSLTTGRVLDTRALFHKGLETTGTPFLETSIDSGKTIQVRLVVSGLKEAGESAAELVLNGQAHRLSAVQYQVHFNVGVQFPVPEKPLLTLERGGSGLLVLKNDDPLSYAVAWHLFVPHSGQGLEGRVVLPGRSTLPLPVTPPEDWFRSWFDGLFKDEQCFGLLRLAFAPGAPADISGGPVRTLPLELRLSYWSDTARDWVGNGVLILVLLLGGFCSLYLSLWIPSKIAQIELTRRLVELSRKTRFITRKMDSQLRVLVRVERLRLWETVQALSMLNAESADRLKSFEKEVDALSARVELVAAIDEVTQRLDALRARTSGAPPTLVDQASRSLDDATVLLKGRTLTESDLQMARTSIAAAVSRLDRLDQEDPELAKRLAFHVKTLRQEYDELQGDLGSRPKCVELRPRLADLFEVLRSPRYEDAAAITPDKYHWIDVSIEKLFVLRHYIIRFEDTATDPDRNRRIARCEADLIEYLKLQSPSTLELARRLREEIEQDVFPSDVRDQLVKGNIEIKSEPLTADANRPVRLWVEFSDPRFRHCAALRDFRCVWDFGSTVGKEQGWEIAHYFRKESEASFMVGFKTSDGKPVALDECVRTTSEWRIPFRAGFEARRSERGKVETGRLLLALFIAVLALISGAREQLLKLDIFPGLVAVFLIGFGADTIKNLFSKRL